MKQGGPGTALRGHADSTRGGSHLGRRAGDASGGSARLRSWTAREGVRARHRGAKPVARSRPGPDEPVRPPTAARPPRWPRGEGRMTPGPRRPSRCPEGVRRTRRSYRPTRPWRQLRGRSAGGRARLCAEQASSARPQGRSWSMDICGAMVAAAPTVKGLPPEGGGRGRLLVRQARVERDLEHRVSRQGSANSPPSSPPCAAWRRPSPVSDRARWRR